MATEVPTQEINPSFGERFANSASEKITKGVDSAGLYIANEYPKAAEAVDKAMKKFGFDPPFKKYTADEILRQAGSIDAPVYSEASLDGFETPSAAEANATGVGVDTKPRDHIISLRDQDGYLLEFFVMPTVIEQHDADYEPIAPSQFPGEFQKYRGTKAVRWNLTAKFISRNVAEATLNLAHLNRLRSWVMPYFGEKTAANPDMKTKLGAPPPILKFKGFRGVIDEVPVVMTTVNWNWPDDVDYIQALATDKLFAVKPGFIRDLEDPDALLRDMLKFEASATVPFPTILSVSIALVESYSASEFNDFDLAKYRQGLIKSAFSAKPAEVTATPVSGEPQAQAPQRPHFSDARFEYAVGRGGQYGPDPAPKATFSDARFEANRSKFDTLVDKSTKKLTSLGYNKATSAVEAYTKTYLNKK